jgi:hypothetical protein
MYSLPYIWKHSNFRVFRHSFGHKLHEVRNVVEKNTGLSKR